MHRPRPRSLATITVALVAIVAIVAIAVILVGGDGDSDFDFEAVADPSGALHIEVPADWTDVATEPFESGDRAAPYVQAAPDLDDYRERVGAPGMEALLVEGLGGRDVRLILAETEERLRSVERCTDRRERRAGWNGWDGLVAVHSACGPESAEVRLFVLAAPSDDALLVVGIQGASVSERERILESLTGPAG